MYLTERQRHIKHGRIVPNARPDYVDQLEYGPTAFLRMQPWPIEYIRAHDLGTGALSLDDRGRDRAATLVDETLRSSVS